MNPSQEQDQIASNEFIEGELSEEDLMKIAAGILDVKANALDTNANVGLGIY